MDIKRTVTITPSPEPNPTIVEIILPASPTGRVSEQAFLFKVPSAGALAVTANRLLKFEFPAWRNASVFLRLISQHVHSPKPSKKTLDALPVTMLESFCATLWEHGVAGNADLSDNRNALLNLLVLAMEMIEFRPEALVLADVETLGRTDSGDYTTQLHSYYFKGQTDRNTLRTILEQHQCRTDFIDANAAGQDSLTAYLACRRLTHPFAWGDLLDMLAETETDLAAYPALYELMQHHRTLETSGLYEQFQGEGGLNPETVFAWIDRLSGQLLQSGGRPVREVVIVEGETERRLLPLFARSAGIDFDGMGIFVMPAGGKNQVSAMYSRLADVLNGPMFVLLDTDAMEAGDAVKQQLRTGDAVYVLSEGEFEDTYDPALVVKTINRHYQPHPPVTQATLAQQMRDHQYTGRVELFKALWVDHQWGQFDKTDFALKMADAVENSQRPPDSIRKLLDAIVKIHPKTLQATT